MTRRIRMLGLGLAIAAIAAMALSATASACSCAGRPGKETFRMADGAVVAKLLRVEPIGDGLSSDYVYRITESFKRTDRFQPRQTRRIRSATNGAACGIEASIGSTHGLYLTRDGAGRLTSNLCSITSANRIRRTAEAVGATTSSALTAAGGSGSCAAASA